jgi:hypothetical protein
MLYDDKVYDEYADLIKNKEKQFGNRLIKRIIDPNFGNKTISSLPDRERELLQYTNVYPKFIQSCLVNAAKQNP